MDSFSHTKHSSWSKKNRNLADRLNAERKQVNITKALEGICAVMIYNFGIILRGRRLDRLVSQTYPGTSCWLIFFH